MSNNYLGKIINILPNIDHSPSTDIYKFFKDIARREVEEIYASEKTDSIDMGHIGTINFPYCKLGSGTIDSMNLFDLDELIIFSFYWINRDRYTSVLDLGANIGLHSIVMSKCGYTVESYEPDPENFKSASRRLELNDITSSVVIHDMAISNKYDSVNFIRVLGNVTGSHIAGCKKNPYGFLEEIVVGTYPLNDCMDWADLIKMDIEGHEKDVLISVDPKRWKNTDALVELQNQNNAEGIYNYFNNIDIGMFSQKTNWRRVKEIKDMPVNYKEGTLFISAKSEMPWGR